MLSLPTFESEGMRKNCPESTSITTSSSIGDGRRERDGERVEGREGVSVSEKNGILGIVLEVVEGGWWRGGYEELNATILKEF